MASKKFVALAIPGREFWYSSNSAHAVPAASAEYICKILNQYKFKGADGVNRVWHIYECEGYDDIRLPLSFQKFTVRKGIVKEVFYS